MTKEKKKLLLDKNKKIINMVIEKAKTQFQEDIGLIGLTGSFSTEDFHEKSDLDLIIVNVTPRGWDIAYGFIYDDVGYDIYCTPWSPRIEEQSRLESPMASCLLDMEVLYCAKPEYREKLEAYRQNARELLAKPIGRECLERAKKYLDTAKQNFADMVLTEEIGPVRYAAGCVLVELVNALTSMNNTTIKRGIKRYPDIIAGYRHQPDHLKELYTAAVEAGSALEIRSATKRLLAGVLELYDTMMDDFVEKPIPTFENLWGTYEELWSNCRNKILHSTALEDRSYALLAACGAQNYLDEMHELFGTKKYDVMQYFDPQNLPAFRDAFLEIMEDYLGEYRKAGRQVEQFDTFEELYEKFMSR